MSGLKLIGKDVIGSCVEYGLRYGCGKSIESVKERKMQKRQNSGLQ